MPDQVETNKPPPSATQAPLPPTLPAGLTNLSQTAFLGIYVAAGLGHVAFIITCSVYFTLISVRASATLHHDTIKRVLHAPLSWYDSTPSGRTPAPGVGGNETNAFGAVDPSVIGGALGFVLFSAIASKVMGG